VQSSDDSKEDVVAPLQYGTARVLVYPSRDELGAAAARHAADLIHQAILARGKARLVVATGNSQLNLIHALVEIPGVEWSRVEVFHMDEYVGMPLTHPSSFRLWIKLLIEDKVHPAVVNYMEGDAPDPDAEMERYSRLLRAEPIDLAFVGFGENGHIAFNDPHIADFNDPAEVKRVSPDEVSRRQQAGEGHFANPDLMPREAFTMTCPALFRAGAWVCSVQELRKAQAVRCALEGPISTACPASIVRTHPNATVYLDRESASLLTGLRIASLKR
jgi:glucosamine-6-phosphate deaminase